MVDQHGDHGVGAVLFDGLAQGRGHHREPALGARLGGRDQRGDGVQAGPELRWGRAPFALCRGLVAELPGAGDLPVLQGDVGAQHQDEGAGVRYAVPVGLRGGLVEAGEGAVAVARAEGEFGEAGDEEGGLGVGADLVGQLKCLLVGRLRLVEVAADHGSLADRAGELGADPAVADAPAEDLQGGEVVVDARHAAG